MESDWSDASSFATELSFEVEDFSPPPSPEVEEGELSVDTGPEPYQFEPLEAESILFIFFILQKHNILFRL